MGNNRYGVSFCSSGNLPLVFWTMKTLKEAQRFAEYNPDKISIEREVRYFAVIGNTRYALVHDWTIEELERGIWDNQSPAEALANRGE